MKGQKMMKIEKTMQTKKAVYFFLMYVPVIAALISLQFLPDKIPAHYGLDNQVTRWGSKYEALIWPVVTVFMGYFMLAMARLAARQEEYGKNNEKAIVTAGILVLILFNGINAYQLYTDFNRVENLSAVPFDIYQLVFGLVGVLMVIVGNIMPKLRMNSVVGLRTRWSLKNEATWKKSQRFGGISYMVAGAIMIGVCVAIKGIPCFLAVLGIWGMLIAIDVFFTYRVAQEE